jgi:hypothetical protein
VPRELRVQCVYLFHLYSCSFVLCERYNSLYCFLVKLFLVKLLAVKTGVSIVRIVGVGTDTGPIKMSHSSVRFIN